MQVQWSLNQLTVVENGEILNKASGSENGQIIDTSNLYYRQIAVYKYKYNFLIFKNLPRLLTWSTDEREIKDSFPESTLKPS